MRGYAGGVGGTYNWADALNLEGQLSGEERLVRDQANHYAQTKLLPRVTNAYRNETFDREIMREMGDLGLLGATIEGCRVALRRVALRRNFVFSRLACVASKGYGCSGVNYVTYGLVAREVER